MELVISLILEPILLLFYVVSGVCGYFVNLTSINSKPRRKFPIVFVHGWLTQNPLYLFLKRYLERKGFVVYMTDFGLLLNDFFADARKLEEYMNERDLKDVILVGVSGGGIVSYLYLQRLGGWERVKRFISIGTPLRGSWLAILASWFSGSARQMVPGSSFLKEIEGEKIINPESIVSVSALFDEIVPFI